MRRLAYLSLSLWLATSCIACSAIEDHTVAVAGEHYSVTQEVIDYRVHERICKYFPMGYGGYSDGCREQTAPEPKPIGG